MGTVENFMENKKILENDKMYCKGKKTYRNIVLLTTKNISASLQQIYIYN